MISPILVWSINSNPAKKRIPNSDTTISRHEKRIGRNAYRLHSNSRPRVVPDAASSSVTFKHRISRGIKMYSMVANGWDTRFHTVSLIPRISIVLRICRYSIRKVGIYRNITTRGIVTAWGSLIHVCSSQYPKSHHHDRNQF